MRHVLVIEDRWLLAQVVADVALCAGATSVAIAQTEEEALALAREHKPAVILCDVDLRAGGRCPDAVERIHREFGPVPAIFITATPDDADALLYGTKILTKPISANELLETVGAIVEHLPARRAVIH